MKICYIWVNRFRNLENFGLNLSSNQKFKFNYESLSLIRKRTANLPEDFFGSQITEVTGIIGKNGAGKSNCLELICKILKGAKTSLHSDFLVIYETDGELICEFSFNNIQSSPKANFSMEFKQYDGNINPLKVVYFSNVFDERKTDFDKEISDISVNNLHRKQHFLRPILSTAFQDQVAFITSKLFGTVGIEVPTKVQLISRVWNNRFNIFSERELFGNAQESIKELKLMFRDRTRDLKEETKFISLLRFGYFFDIITQIAKRFRSNGTNINKEFPRLKDFINSIIPLRTEDISERLIKYLKSHILPNISKSLDIYSPYQRKPKEISIDRIKKQIDFLLKIRERAESLELEYFSEGSRAREIEYFTFDYNHRGHYNFINEYIDIFGSDGAFEINWLGISSGHKAYLNLFSSIYKELRYSRTGHLLLCIDEGDLYLHPKWQIEFFSKLITILPIIYSGKIQIILTSHSPFLLSDLPKQNVSILDKDSPNHSIDGSELRKNTFGGNLYNLYAEPFFLGTRRTSDFAYKKIKEALESADKNITSNEDMLKIRKIANLVGDEIVKFQINSLLPNDKD